VEPGIKAEAGLVIATADKALYEAKKPPQPGTFKEYAG
jgi:hypothetical protein